MDLHGPPSQKAWIAAKHRPELPAGDMDPMWPHRLDGLFDHIILDEAHILRNEGSAQSITVRWLKARFHVCLSATALYNSINDFKGYLPLIIPDGLDSAWTAESLEKLGVNPAVNPFELDDEEAGSGHRPTANFLMHGCILPLSFSSRPSVAQTIQPISLAMDS
jgi:hypothetical protein